ncbi:hypothetical protein ATL41_1791 [Flavimobilis soli]|jgi:hypothetical protein|uniref:Uncharacterized protein n=1 Tax=Flavimobilis soli TaxID=442709 RepID=A0A2A9EDP8_9MICO|nr:hypothetical protein [Flavimobilis soli]PFG37044.1 hypothetical protein ATL41_1791 [Flavimobilis soli]
MDSTSPSENAPTGAAVLAHEYATDLEALSGVVTGIMAVPE